jgi:hypothetical protein
MLAQHRVDQISVPVDRPVEVAPPAANLQVRASGAGQLHPRALSEPDVILSHHPAPIGKRLPIDKTGMYRYKTVIGRWLHARTLPNQRTDARVGCTVLNRMTGLGMPVTVRIL